MASTAPINHPLNDGYYVAKMSTLKASSAIPHGVVCVAVSGKITEVAGATAGQTLLGASMQPLYELTGADVTLPSPASFARGCCLQMGIDAGDTVADADVGKTVYFTDGSTIHKTSAANDVSCTLVAIVSATECLVQIG